MTVEFRSQTVETGCQGPSPGCSIRAFAGSPSTMWMGEMASTAQPDWALEVRVLGEFAVRRNGEDVALPPSRKTRALLAYLAVVGRPQRRERLCQMFWARPDDPRGALRWSLSK